MGVKVIKNHNEFKQELTNNKTLVVVDFTASWCGPCKRIAPFYEQMALKYSQNIFLKIDVNTCQETALSEGVTSMPTFVFYKDGFPVDRISGANPQALEEKIIQYSAVIDGTETKSPVKGHCDLIPFILQADGEALNEASEHPLKNIFKDDESFLASSCDNQLIIPIYFNQAVKLHSIVLKAPEKSGPKTLHIFINQPKTIDFDCASKNKPIQIIETKPEELNAGNVIPLEFVKFQNVQNVQFFIENNHDGSDVTQINYMQLIGSPVQTTNMSELKRVAGQEGEPH